jgi:hypothetical protein
MDPQVMIQARRKSVDERIAEVRAELAGLEQERAELDVAERVFAKLMAPTGDNGVDIIAVAGDKTYAVEAKAVVPHVGNQTFEQEVRDIILGVGRPMPRAEIAAALAERGMQLPGKDPAKLVTVRLGRLGPDMFRYFEPHGWWPADMPCTSMGYRPHDTE